MPSSQRIKQKYDTSATCATSLLYPAYAQYQLLLQMSGVQAKPQYMLEIKQIILNSRSANFVVRLLALVVVTNRGRKLKS